MKFGFSLPHHGRLASADAIKRIAELSEEEGYDSVWVSDHLILPQKEDLSNYRVLYEPLITLAFIASLAPTVLLGTSVILLPLRNPILLAKQAASLDAITGGRLILGVGAGYIQEEFTALGASFSQRGLIMNEAVNIMKALWTEDDPKYRGRFNTINGGWFEPKPKQKGGPPILIGGYTDAALKRAATIGDGWHPMGVSPSQIQLGKQKMKKISPSESEFLIVPKNVVEITEESTSNVFNEYWSASSKLEGTTRIKLRGSISELIEGIQKYVEAGVQHFVFNQPNTMTFESLCQQLKTLAREVIPSFE